MPTIQLSFLYRNPIGIDDGYITESNHRTRSDREIIDHVNDPNLKSYGTGSRKHNQMFTN